jgi:hypothetical protein
MAFSPITIEPMGATMIIPRTWFIPAFGMPFNGGSTFSGLEINPAP